MILTVMGPFSKGFVGRFSKCRQNYIICEGDKFVFKDLRSVHCFITIDVILFRSRHNCWSSPLYRL